MCVIRWKTCVLQRQPSNMIRSSRQRRCISDYSMRGTGWRRTWVHNTGWQTTVRLSVVDNFDSILFDVNQMAALLSKPLKAVTVRLDTSNSTNKTEIRLATNFYSNHVRHIDLGNVSGDLTGFTTVVISFSGRNRRLLYFTSCYQCLLFIAYITYRFSTVQLLAHLNNRVP